ALLRVISSRSTTVAADGSASSFSGTASAETTTSALTGGADCARRNEDERRAGRTRRPRRNRERDIERLHAWVPSSHRKGCGRACGGGRALLEPRRRRNGFDVPRAGLLASGSPAPDPFP